MSFAFPTMVELSSALLITTLVKGDHQENTIHWEIELKS